MQGGTMNSKIDKELATEQARLNDLIEKAIQKGTPILNNQEILEQSQRVDQLVNEYQKQLKRRNEPSR
jgi:hypothetical protein